MTFLHRLERRLSYQNTTVSFPDAASLRRQHCLHNFFLTPALLRILLKRCCSLHFKRSLPSLVLPFFYHFSFLRFETGGRRDAPPRSFNALFHGFLHELDCFLIERHV